MIVKNWVIKLIEIREVVGISSAYSGREEQLRTIETNKIAKTRVLIHTSARNCFSINSKSYANTDISAQIKISDSQLMS